MPALVHDFVLRHRGQESDKITGMLEMAQLIPSAEKRSPHRLDKVTGTIFRTQPAIQTPTNGSTQLPAVLGDQPFYSGLRTLGDLLHQVMKAAFQSAHRLTRRLACLWTNHHVAVHY
jgi:hypothetical protein